jgi:hypothetical protein
MPTSRLETNRPRRLRALAKTRTASELPLRQPLGHKLVTVAVVPGAEACPQGCSIC